MGKQKCIKTTSVSSPPCSPNEFKSQPCFTTGVLSLLAANFSQGPPLQCKMKRKLWKDVSHSFSKLFMFFKFLSQLPNIFSGSIIIPAHRMETKSAKTDTVIHKKYPKPPVLSQWSLTFRILPEHSSNIPFVCCHLLPT